MILRALARHGRNGARLVDLPAATGLSRPTIYRLLQSLASERLVAQREDKRYTLGPALFELGLAAPSPVGDLAELRRIIQRLADRCGDVAYLAIRHGDYASYLIHAEGEYPIRTHVVAVGSTIPLTESYGGLALLASTDSTEAGDVVQRLNPEYADERMRVIRSMAGMLREHGYAGGHDLVLGGAAGIAGLAAPVPTPVGYYLVVSVSMIADRLPSGRVDVLGRMLKQTATEIAAQVAHRR